MAKLVLIFVSEILLKLPLKKTEELNNESTSGDEVLLSFNRYNYLITTRTLGQRAVLTILGQDNMWVALALY